MRRFLVVGCGGSGGSTLAYMMDQLRSELGAFGFDLPMGWQFVHIDVPTGPDAPPDGLGNVQVQGGEYVATGPVGGSYPLLDGALSRYPGLLDGIATWAPRDPERVGTPINEGAGQYRAIGRMIMLSRAQDVLSRLTRAFEQLNRTEAVQEMSAIGATVPGAEAFDPRNEPIVLVVSSMAGGAGASMALDVCRLLTIVRGVAANRIGVFLYSADVFDYLPPDRRAGVRGNSLAMLGEIVAAQAGAAGTHDQSVLSALGLNVGADTGAPFARVFPISNLVGMTHNPFATEAKDVYRAVARGLSGLMMSGQATHELIRYDLTNDESIASSQEDFGWGAPVNAMAWGGFGYACLSTGRDRFGEYAAQRIASGAVDRLVTGHRNPGNTASDTVQVRALLESQWPDACTKLQLPRVKAEFYGWVQHVVAADAERSAHDIVATDVAPYVSAPIAGQTGPVFLDQLQRQLADRRDRIRSRAEAAAYSMTFDWNARFTKQVRDQVAAAVAEFGVPYAMALVDEIARALQENVLPDAAPGSRVSQDPATVPPESAQTIGLIRGAIANGQQVLGAALDKLRSPIRGAVLSLTCGFLAQLIPDLITSFLGPLHLALQDALQVLEDERNTSRPRVDAGLARLKTDEYLAWPSDSDQQVPARFTHALNEVLLIRASEFDRQFRADLIGSVESIASGGGHFDQPRSTEADYYSARREVLRRVLAGEWPTTGSDQPPRNLLEQTQLWNASVLNHDPHDPQSRFVPQPAQFFLHARPNEVLQRARSYVERPGSSFDAFIRTSLRKLLADQIGAEAENRQRQAHVLAGFEEALRRAQPMISVDRDAVRRVHPGEAVRYRYKFSRVPFAGLSMAEEMRRVLETDQDVDQTAVDTFLEALKADDTVTRVDIFGSYANLSPITFDAVLTPAAQEWAATPYAGRERYWKWRRSRPLTAALPMGDDERRSMVGGWFVGHILGVLRTPRPPYDHRTGPAEIWDADTAQWLPFPHPLLTPPERFLADYDWLPSILESYLLAVANAPTPPLFSSLRPYHLLRNLYDENPEKPTVPRPHTQLAAERNLGRWLLTGHGADGQVSGTLGLDGTESPEDRAKVATEWLERIGALARDEYMTVREGGRGHGAFSAITQRRQAARTPIFRDIAADVFEVTSNLRNLIAHALTQPQYMEDPTRYPDDDGFTAPSAGVTF